MWLKICCWVSKRNRRGCIESGKFCLILNFQRDKVFGNAKIQGVSNRVERKESLKLKAMVMSRN